MRPNKHPAEHAATPCTQAPASWGSAEQQATALAILSGSASQEELRYLKSTSLHLWLFGYELPGTQCLLSRAVLKHPSQQVCVVPPIAC